MKVHCIRIENGLGFEVGISPWLTKGHTYDVITMAVDVKGQVTVQILTDQDQMPAIFSMSLFEIVDGNIPANWKIDVCKGAIEFSPYPWKQAGFWERFFDNEEHARSVFHAELKTIITDYALVNVKSESRNL